jgi:hypothetical protein
MVARSFATDIAVRIDSIEAGCMNVCSLSTQTLSDTVQPYLLTDLAIAQTACHSSLLVELRLDLQLLAAID